MRPLAGLLLLALAACAPVQGALEQGGLAQGRVPPGAHVWLDGRPVPVAADGRFLVGWGREAGPESWLVVQGPGRRLTLDRLEIAPRVWDEQRITGLAEPMVTPDPALQARIAADNRRIAAVRGASSPDPLFASGLVRPAEGVVSGVFGSRRVLNGQPRSPHSGVDYAAAQGAPVLAAGDGWVSLAESDMVYTGGTVMIDHGLGLQTVYAHLLDYSVTVGQRVAKGQPIGRVGASGRATGPHLHFGTSWTDVRLDPETVLRVLE